MQMSEKDAPKVSLIDDEWYNGTLTIESLDPNQYTDEQLEQLDEMPNYLKFCFEAISFSVAHVRALHEFAIEDNLPYDLSTEFAIDTQSDHLILALVNEIGSDVSAFWAMCGYDEALKLAKMDPENTADDDIISDMFGYLTCFTYGFLYGWSGVYGCKLDIENVDDVPNLTDIPMALRMKLRSFNDKHIEFDEDVEISYALKFVDMAYSVDDGDIRSLNRAYYAACGVICGMDAAYDYDWFSFDEYIDTYDDMNGNYFVLGCYIDEGDIPRISRNLHIIEDNIIVENDDDGNAVGLSMRLSTSGKLKFDPEDDAVDIEDMQIDNSVNIPKRQKKKPRPHKKGKKRKR